MKTIFTGIQSSGNLHIGNYFGAMKRMIDRQAPENQVIIMVADLHSFTTNKDPELFKQLQYDSMIDWLSCGVDIDTTIFFLQSDIRAHTELTWLLSCFTPMGMLERATSYKDKIEKGIEPNAGLFVYPVLQTCDILLYDADIVPVGKDQKQHLEMARDIAQKFNHYYGDTFKIPESDIDASVQIIPGLDGEKMSKSYSNTIPIFGTEKDIKKKVMSIKTESIALGEPIDPNCIPMQFHKLFGNPYYDELVSKCESGSVGFGDLKKELFGLIWEYFTDARVLRKKLESDPEYINECMVKGAKRANKKAESVLLRVREKMGLGRHIF